MPSPNKLLVSTIALLLSGELAMAYNADAHEATIRQSCNSLTNGEERWGCFSGDITVIEQIRRRQRSEKRHGESSARPSYRPPTQRPTQRPIEPNFESNRDQNVDEEQAKPALIKPKKIATTATPVAKPVAAPAAKIAPLKDAGDLQIKADIKPVSSSALPPLPSVPGIVTDPVKIFMTAPSLAESGTAKKETFNPQDVRILNAKPAPAAAAATPTSPPPKRPLPEKQDPKVISQQPQEPKAPAKKADETPQVAEKPVLPTKFEMTCAQNVSDLDRKPHMREALRNILGTPSLKRGETKEFAVRGTRLNPKACLGVFTQTLRNCTAQIQADSIQIRARNDGQLQTFVNDEWVDVKTCTNGEEIVTSYSFTNSTYVFNMKSRMSRKNGNLNSVTTGHLKNDPTYTVNFAVLKVLSGSSQQSPQFVSRSTRPPGGRQ